MTLDPEVKKEMSDFFARYWAYEPQKSFPEMVEFFKEQGIDIRIRPHSKQWKERDIVFCDACGHAVGKVTPDMGRFGGGQFTSFKKEREDQGWKEKHGWPDIEFVAAKEEDNA